MKTLTEDYILSEVRQTDKDKYYMISLYVDSKKNDANEPTVGQGGGRQRGGWIGSWGWTCTRYYILNG